MQLSFSKFPELFTWLKEFLGYKDSSPMDNVASLKERTSGELHHLEIGRFETSPTHYCSRASLTLRKH